MGHFVRRRNLVMGAVGLVGLFAAAHVLLAVLIECKFVDATQDSVGAKVDVQETQLSLLTGASSPDSKPTPGGARSDPIVFDDSQAGLPPFTRDPSKPFAHPHYWAPFVLIGNWR